MARTKVVIQGAGNGAEIPRIDQIDAVVEWRYARTTAELVAALPGAEVLFGWDFRCGDLSGAWHAAENLRWVHWPGAGVDAVLFPELVESDVVLTNSRGVFDRAMAEYALGLILAMAKGFPQILALQSRVRWEYRMNEMLAGKQVLVVGAGSIGGAVAGLLRCVGMKVTGVARRARSEDPSFDEVFAVDDLDTLLTAPDYIILVAPLTKQTRHMIGAAQFRRMKTTARLVNLGRGDLIDEQALIAALDAGEIDGAALDVFHTEPLPAENPLWAMPNVIVSPHVSGDFVEHRTVLADLFIENFRRYRSGKPLLNVVDKRRGYVPAATP